MKNHLIYVGLICGIMMTACSHEKSIKKEKDPETSSQETQVKERNKLHLEKQRELWPKTSR